MEYLDFDMEVEEGTAQGTYDVSVVQSAAGEARAQMRFPYDRLVLQNKIQALQIELLRARGVRRGPSAGVDTVRDLGSDLYAALFSGDVASRLEVTQSIAKSQGRGVRIKLRIGAAELLGLPWEYMYDAATGDYLALAVSTPLVRYLSIPQSIEPLEVSPPLRILAMTAGPKDLGELDVARERQRLDLALDSLRKRGLVELEWVQGETWEDLQQALWNGPWHVFHFVGHGGFNERKGSGVIYLTGEDGNARELSALDVARLLGDHEPLRLAILNSCETAQGTATDVFSSTAAALVRRGTPAVVAMQFAITDDAAIQFSKVFYAATAHGMPVDSAVAEARKAVALQLGTYEWGTPVLFMRSPDGVLFRVPPPVSAEAAVEVAKSSESPPPAIPDSSPEPVEAVEPAVEAPALVAPVVAATPAPVTDPSPQPAPPQAAPPQTAPAQPAQTPPPPAQPTQQAQQSPPAQPASPLVAPSFASIGAYGETRPQQSSAGPAGFAPPPPPPPSGYSAWANSYVPARSHGGNKTRTTVVLVVAVAVVVFFGLSVLIGALSNALTPPPAVGPSLQLFPSTGPPGTTVGVAGAGFLPQADVSVAWVDGRNRLVAQSDGTGFFNVSMTVPDGVGAGDFLLVARDPTGAQIGHFLVLSSGADNVDPVVTPANDLPEQDVVNAVCSVEMDASLVADARTGIESALASSDRATASDYYDVLMSLLSQIDSNIEIAGTWDPMSNVADQLRAALADWASAVDSYYNDQSSENASALSDQTETVNSAVYGWSTFHQAHPELGVECWSSGS